MCVRSANFFLTQCTCIQAQGKGGSASAADTIAEIQKFEAKVQRDLDAYTAQNNKTKQAIIAAKLRHDELMDTLLITVATTQVSATSLRDSSTACWCAVLYT